MTTWIELSTPGMTAQVDDEDAARVLAAVPWHGSVCDGHLYARHWYRDQFGIPHAISMHTLLTGWCYVDHINGDGLDNRRSNLREATHSQNAGNSRIATHNTSGFKGVSLYRRTGKYRAYITGSFGRPQHLGYFDNAEEAARVYDQAALARWGEFAFLNFPQEKSA